MTRLLAALLVVLAACAPASLPSPSPSDSTVPRLVLGHEQLGTAYVLPAAAIEVDGLLHLWVLTLTGEDGQVPGIVHLTSADGLAWNDDGSETAFETELGFDTIGPVPSSVLVEPDGTWHMFGGGRTAEGDRPIVWTASAPSANGPWTFSDDPILQPEGAGWDGLVTDHPSVVAADEGYLMAYGGAGAPDSNRNRIGFARSADGIIWERVPATLDGADDALALGPSACGIDARSMVEPILLETDAGLRLYFGAMRSGTDSMVIGMADSPDGTAWNCPGAGPVVEPADFPGSPDLHSYLGLRAGDRELLLVEVLGPGSSDVWLVER
jgi:hypothetical protein